MRVLVDETEFRASPTGTVVRLVVLRSQGDADRRLTPGPGSGPGAGPAS